MSSTILNSVVLGLILFILPLTYSIISAHELYKVTGSITVKRDKKNVHVGTGDMK